MLSLNHTFTGKLKRWAETSPDIEAYVFRQPRSSEWERLSITFRELDRKSSVLASWMLEMGIGPGDRVLAVGDNCPGWIYVDYASMKVKALLIRASADMQSSASLLELLRDHRCTALFINPGETDEILNQLSSFIPLSSEGLQEHASLHLRYIVSLTEATSFKLPNLENILESTPSGSAMEQLNTILDGIKPTDFLTTFSTSGSTGPPKIVVHTHQSFSGAYWSGYNQEGFQQGVSKFFNDRNFSWVGSAAYIPVMFGVTNICVDPKYTLVLKQYDFVFDVLVEEKVSHGLLLPYLLHDMVERESKMPHGDFPSLQSAVTGGERFSNDLRKDAIRIIPKLKLLYGLTECIIVARWNLFEDDAHGEICEGKEIKILSEGQSLPEGDPGEVLVRGPHVFHSYLDDPKHTKAAFTTDGWFHTGDMGKIDSRGRIQLLGRKTEVISHGTRKIYPSTIEKTVKEMPSVAQCVVVGVPDPRVFEEICAFVVPKEGFSVTTDDVINYSKVRMLGNADIGCVPKYVIIGDTVPTVTTGKVDRKAIRVMAVEQFSVE